MDRSWLYPTVILCTFGFIKELRPVEPFLTPFLRSKNLTETEIENQIYPFWTYSYMLSIVFVFLLTDILRYKPVIIVEGLALMASGCLMIWGDTLALMRLMQCMYGLGTAADIGYYAYIYAVVPKEKYRQVSSYTRTLYLIGRFTSSVIGQIFVTYELLSYAQLNIFGTISVAVATCISLLLPRAKKSLFFHRSLSEEDITNASAEDESYKAVQSQSNEDQTINSYYGNTCEQSQENVKEDTPPKKSTFELCYDSEESPSQSFCRKFIQDFRSLWLEFRTCYSDLHLVQWSIWWAIASCGHLQVLNYGQNLWDLIYIKNGNEDLPTDLYYGAVEAASTLTGAIASFLIMFPKSDWDKIGEFLMGVISLVDAVVLIFMGLTTNIWVAYVGYILFNSSYQLMITIATFQIAKTLTVQRYALVFGWNTFIALVLESILTFIVVGKTVLSSPADIQFVIYGCYFGVLAIAFLSKVIFVLVKNRRSQ